MIAVLSSFTTLLVVMFICYVCFIFVPFLRYPKVAIGKVEAFDWHLFIPCRDEAAVIATTIERARGDFPDAHVWVIDDDSDDETGAIARSYAEHDPLVHVVQRRRPDARTGKGDALNTAYLELNRWLPADADRTRTIITVVDADGEMARDALEVVASDEVFGDQTIGAAQIAVWMKNRDDKKPYPKAGALRNLVARWLVRMQDVEFRTVIAGMQSLRARTGTVGLGGNGQFTRLSVLDEIAHQYGEPWHGALLEDYELGIHVLLAGSRIKHVYDTHVSQEALPSVRRLLTQRTRWTQGNIQCVRYVPDILRSRHFDAAGVLETCYYLLLPFLQLLGMLAFGLIAAISLFQAIVNPSALAIQSHNLVWTILLFLVVAFGPFVIWGPAYKLRCEPGVSWPRALLCGLGLWFYVFYMYVSLFRAVGRLIRGKTGWSKTRRNAEEHQKAAGSVAIEA